ncbi:MAG: LamG-like jellyroll fold domain-containing protein [Gemmataceae bacterium]
MSSKKSLAARLLTRAFRPRPAAPIVRPTGAVGGRIEELEDRSVPALINYYQAEGNATDSQGANNGAFTAPAFTAGYFGQAFSFTGSNYVTINRSVQNDFTLAAWIKTTAAGTGTQFYNGNPLITAEVGGVTNDFGTTVINGKFAFGVGNPDQTIQSTTSVNDNTWHHVAAVRQGTTIRVYVDGVLENTLTGANGGTLSANANITIGRDLVNGIGFPGLVDDVRVYDNALTGAEVASLAQLPSYYAAEGNANDSTAGRNGTFSAPAAYAPGVVGQAFSFNTADQVTVPANPAFDFTTGTVTAFFNAPADGNNRGILSMRTAVDAGNTRWSIHVNENANTVGIWNGSSFQTVPANIVPGVWYHLAAVMTTTTTTFYLNGALLGSTGNGINAAVTGKPFVIGTPNDPAYTHENFGGQIDEVRVFGRALTPAEIASLAQVQSTFVVSNASWMRSTVVDDGGPNGDWTPLRVTPPAAATFTLPAVMGGNTPFVDGQDQTDIGGGALAITAAPNTLFYRTTFTLPTTVGITADVTFSVDNNAQVFLNGQEVAREVSFVVENFNPPSPSGPNGYPAFRINPDGSISNVVRVDNTFNFTNWVAGTNELVVAVRNTNGGGDTGGLVFRMNLTIAPPAGTLTAALSAGTLTVTDTDGTKNNALSVVVSGGNYVLTDAAEQFAGTGGIPGAVLSNGNRTLSVPVASVTSLVLNLAGGDDTATLSYAGGALPPVTFNGGAGGNDALVLQGGTATTQTFNYTNATDGSVVLGGLGSVTYTGLDPITSSIAAAAVVLHYSTTGETITVTAAGAGQTTVTSTAGETTTFVNPTASLAINAGDVGNDTVTVTSLGSGFAAALSIDGGTGTDAITITPALNLSAGGGTLSLSAEAIDLVGGSVTTTGTQTYNGAVVLRANTTTSGANVAFNGTVNAGSPATSSYTLSTPTYNFIDISGTGTAGPTGDDQTFTSIPIGFTFNYFGTPTTVTAISTNGNINPTNNSDPTYTPVSLPSASAPSGIIAGWWTDLYPPAGGTVRYQTVGTAPNRTFIAQWTNVGHYSNGAGPSTFQIQLREGTNLIDVMLPNAATNGSYFHTVGVQDVTSTIGTNAYFGVAGLPANSAFRFTPVNSGGGAGSTLTVNSSGTTTFGGAVGTTSALGSLSVTTGTLTASAITTTSGVSITNSGAGSITGAINGGGATLTKAGVGTLTLSGTNGYGGATNVNQGVLNIQNASALGGAASGTTVASGAALEIQGNIAVAEPLTLNGNGIGGTGALRNIASNNFWSGGITLASNATIGGTSGGGNELVIQTVGIGESGGSRTLDVVGPISLVMSAPNTYTGTTTMSGSGAGSLRLRASGTTINGNLVIGDGTVAKGAFLDNSNQIADTATVTVNANSVLGMGPFGPVTETISRLTGTGNVSASSAGLNTLTVGGNNGSSTFDGTLTNGSGTLALIKTGNGTFTLTNANTYTGTTTVSVGRLNVNGSTAAGSAVTVNGGTLGGTGTVGGTVAMSSGTVAPGTSPGVLNSGSVTFTGGTFQVEVNGTTVGTQYDQLNVTGAVALGAGTTALSLPTPTIAAGATYTIINNDGTDNVTGYFTGLPEGAFVGTFGSTNVYITYAGGTNNNDVQLLTTPTVNGTAGADQMVLRQKAGAPGNYQFSIDSGATFADLGAITSLTVNGLDGNDTLTIDAVNGNPFPSGGVTYNGGNPTTGPGDQLRVVAGTYTTITHNFTTANSGNVAFNDGSSTRTVFYTGLEPVLVNVGSVADVIFNLPAAASTAVLEDDGTSGNTLSRLRSTNGTFEVTTFNNPTGSVTINRGNSADTLTVTALPDLTSTLTIGTGASPFQAVSVTGAVTLAPTKDLAAFATRISVTGAISADDITLDADTGAQVTGSAFVGADISANVTGSGVVTIEGRGGDTGGSQVGVQVRGGAVVEGGAGAGDGTVIRGRGGNSAAGSNSGVFMNGGTIRSAGGDVRVTGTAGAGTNNLAGVTLVASSLITAGGSGNVFVTGFGGTGTGNTNRGVVVTSGSVVTTAGAGSVDVRGTGGVGTTGLHGVWVTNTGQITAGSGSVTVVGVGGTGTGADNVGVLVSRNVPSSGTVSGSISSPADLIVTGTAGSNTVDGVLVDSAGAVTVSVFTAAGLATLTGLLGSNVTVDSPSTANFGSLTASAAGATVTIFEDSTTAVNTITATTINLTSAGAITDNNLGANNLTGTTATLAAAGGIDLDTTLGSLTATTSAAGAILIDELDAITLTNVTSSNGLITVNAGGTITATNVVSSTDSDANDITLTATGGGNIAVTTINAGTANGDVFLSANTGPGGSIVDDDVDSTRITGDVVTLTAFVDIGQPLSVSQVEDIDTAANTIVATTSSSAVSPPAHGIWIDEANAVTLQNVTTQVDGLIRITTGGNTAAQNVVANGTGRNVTIIESAGNMTVTTVTSTGGNVTLQNTTGSIFDDAVQTTRVSGATVTLTATLGTIGSVVTGDIDTAATNLAVTAGGNASVNELDGVNVNSASVGANVFELFTAGATTETGPGVITAGGFRFTGSGTATLTADNLVTTFAGNRTGDLSFTNNQSLTVSTVTGFTGTTTGVTVAGGTTTITAKNATSNALLTVAQPVSGSGNVVLSSDQNFTLNTGITVASTGSSVTINADVVADLDTTGATVNINGPITSPLTALGSVTINSGGDADTITVTQTGTSNLDVFAGGIVAPATGFDQVTVVFGALGTGFVRLNNSGNDNYRATVDGAAQAGPLTFHANTLLNEVNAPLPSPASGVRRVSVNAATILDYIPAGASLTVLSLLGGTAADTYFVQFTDPAAGLSLLPPLVNVTAAGASDAAFVYGTNSADTVDVNIGDNDRVTSAGVSVRYDGNLEALTVYGKDEVGQPGDTFAVRPDQQTATTIHGGTPLVYPGDTLQLDVLGLVTLNPTLSDPALPNGNFSLTGYPLLTWTSIENFPVPRGLGGSFDFGTPTSPVQFGFTQVLPTSSYPAAATAGTGWFGWATTPLYGNQAYQEPNLPPAVAASPIAALLQDFAYGFQGDPSDGVFRVDVAPNKPVQLTALVGIPVGGRDGLVVEWGVANSPTGLPATWTAITPAGGLFTTGGEMTAVSAALTAADVGNNLSLFVRLRDVTGEPNWSISALDVRPTNPAPPVGQIIPAGLVAPLPLRRVLHRRQRYHPRQLRRPERVRRGRRRRADHRLLPRQGRHPRVARHHLGVERDAGGRGLHGGRHGPRHPVPEPGRGRVPAGVPGPGRRERRVHVRRPPADRHRPGDGDGGRRDRVPGRGVHPAVRAPDHPAARLRAGAGGVHRRLRERRPGRRGLRPVRGRDVHRRGDERPGVDRGEPAGAVRLRRDRDGGPAGRGVRRVRPERVRARHAGRQLRGDGDARRPGARRDDMFVEVWTGTAWVAAKGYNPATNAYDTDLSGLTSPPGVAPDAGQSLVRSFLASTAGGQVRVRFGNVTGNPNWTLAALEVRPAQAALTITRAAGTLTADGTTVTAYTVTGAAPGTVLTVRTALGSPAGADANTTYDGFQVVVPASGPATFSLKAPYSTTLVTSFIEVESVSGGERSVVGEVYAATSAPTVPAVQRFDFNGPSDDTNPSMVGVRGTQLWTAGADYGWLTAVNEFERAATTLPASMTAAQKSLFRDGATLGGPAGTFRVKVDAGADYAVRYYVGDSYRKWPWIRLQVEGARRAASWRRT